MYQDLRYKMLGWREKTANLIQITNSYKWYRSMNEWAVVDGGLMDSQMHNNISFKFLLSSLSVWESSAFPRKRARESFPAGNIRTEAPVLGWPLISDPVCQASLTVVTHTTNRSHQQ